MDPGMGPVRLGFLYAPVCNFLSITAELYYTKYFICLFICLPLTLELQRWRLSAPFRSWYSSSMPLYLLRAAVTHTLKQNFAVNLRWLTHTQRPCFSSSPPPSLFPHLSSPSPAFTFPLILRPIQADSDKQRWTVARNSIHLTCTEKAFPPKSWLFKNLMSCRKVSSIRMKRSKKKSSLSNSPQIYCLLREVKNDSTDFQTPLTMCKDENQNWHFPITHSTHPIFCCLSLFSLATSSTSSWGVKSCSHASWGNSGPASGSPPRLTYVEYSTSTGRHPNQMPKPPQLARFDVNEQRF